VTLASGASIHLAVERPAAGGRMIARLDGRVVLVTGAIPGERVTARIERIAKGVVYADTTSVEDASTDRRVPWTDPACGGCLYAHIAYPRQLEIKSQVIADAFARIGHLELPSLPVRLQASPEEGYRMRARLHVRGRRVGFFREGTHEICDARATRQLLPATSDTIDRLMAALASLGLDAAGEIELSENVEASHRVACVESPFATDPRALERLAQVEGLTGFGPAATVTDTLTIGTAPPVSVRRHVLAFFQGNRYLLSKLAEHVVELVPQGSRLADLYAGTGVFALTAAAARQARVLAVEGDRIAAADLQANAAGYDSVEVRHQSVEAFLSGNVVSPDTLIVDPPRTGMTRDALEGALGLLAGTVIYVSCDVATLARDSKRLVDAGYRLARVDAFDLFPNTPHVETVAMFENPRM
jgi:23S rRNA (uracil1939-C5)-methyltransferase